MRSALVSITVEAAEYVVVEKPAGLVIAAAGLAFGIRGANFNAADHSPLGLAIAGLGGSDVEEEGAGEAEAPGSLGGREEEAVDEEGTAREGSGWFLSNLMPE